MSFDDWMLALHVLSAFAMVAGMTLFWVLIVAGWRTDTPAEILRMGPLAGVAGAAIGIGLGVRVIRDQMDERITKLVAELLPR